jgi:hypothetical protein
MSNETDFDDLYGSKYLGAADLHGEMPNCKIARVEILPLKEKDGSTKRKFVAYLMGVGVDKPLILNKTNAQKLANSFGKDREDWIGVNIQLYTEMTSLGKEGVRVRPLKPPRRGDDSITTGGPPNKDMDDSIPF